MKKIIFLTLLSFLILPTSLVLAETTTDVSVVPTVSTEAVSTVSTEVAPTSIDSSSAINLKNKAKALIKSRVVAMTNLTNKVNRSNISAEQKTSLVGDLKTNIDSLNSLLTKINAETDLAGLKNEVKSIYNDYRIFAIVIPRVQGQLTTYKMIKQSADLSVYVEKVQVKLTEWSSQGQDVSKLQEKVNNSKKYLSNANAKYQEALNLLQGLKPADYPAKAAIDNSRKAINEGNKNLRLARNELYKNSYNLKTLQKKMKNVVKKVENKLNTNNTSITGGISNIRY